MASINDPRNVSQGKAVWEMKRIGAGNQITSPDRPRQRAPQQPERKNNASTATK